MLDVLKNIIIVIFSIIIALLGIELCLYAKGVNPDYSGNIAIDNGFPAKWWFCDNNGCRFDSNYVKDYYALNLNKPYSNFNDRLKIINSNGFHSNYDFIRSDKLRDAFRILVLGDSFT